MSRNCAAVWMRGKAPEEWPRSVGKQVNFKFFKKEKKSSLLGNFEQNSVTVFTNACDLWPQPYLFTSHRFVTRDWRDGRNRTVSTNVDPALISSITVEFVAVISFSVLLSRGLTTASRLTSRAWQFYLPDKLLRNQEFKVEISHLCLHRLSLGLTDATFLSMLCVVINKRALTGFLLMAFMMLCTLTDFLNSSSLSISLLTSGKDPSAWKWLKSP